MWMGKSASKLGTLLSRLIKVVMVVVLVPAVVGLGQSILEQLELPALPSGSFRVWILRGLLTYVGIHLLLYRPTGLFRASHRLFSALAVWLFGGQVASTDSTDPGAAASSKSRKGREKPEKSEGRQPAAQGSTLVVLSPYVVPLYTILVCAATWAARQRLERTWIDAPACVLVGMTLAFHWVMTADDLQQQRKRWHLETYLLAVGLVFTITLLFSGACLSWAVPEFSFVRALQEAGARATLTYTMVVQHLFL